ncbi:MAG: hypothetical protein GY729_16815 [Desulfobacteraceae bacterium]|nr:hypothetical protein [Desulfobacteraceae bacterium]
MKPKKKGLIALMGSGELTPTMVEVHKQLLSAKGRDSKAVFLDTPAGFQLNADDISKKAQEYFKRHIHKDLLIASFKNAKTSSEYDLQMVLRQLETAGYMLVGPGSPSYACRQLLKTPIPEYWARIVESGGSIAIASAAALTSGRHTLPVYEIYKVGQDLHWIDGINVLGRFGLDLVVIPHWNNAEGGTHDTRFCYMGEQRLLALEKLLPEDTVYLGIDEHTACILDCEKETATIYGLGSVTLRQHGQEISFTKKETIPFKVFRQDITQSKKPVLTKKEPSSHSTDTQNEASFWENIHETKDQFKKSLANHDFKTSINALLKLDSHLCKASMNFENEETLSQAREILRDLIVLLGVELQMLQKKTDKLFKPLVDNILQLRTTYKKNEQWNVADALRNVLLQSHILVEDTRNGHQWRIKGESES